MHAISYTRFGAAADVLEWGKVDTPDPGPGEVLVRLSHSGVNPSDAKARAGARPGVTKPAFPRIIPHSDGAGVIEAVGDGVNNARISERVWIWNGQWQRSHGTAAEYIALPAAQAVPMPDAISAETGACLGIPGLTAAHTVFGGGDVKGQTLLISGGAGAVGHNAVQLAKWGGAKVIATASPRDVERVRAAGADHVLDSTPPICRNRCWRPAAAAWTAR
jgi:NADPH2:quinone reductase